MELVDMEVKDVELASALPHLVQHQHVIGNRIADTGVKPQCLGHAGCECRRSDRVTACEQRHVVAKRYQPLGQVGDDAFGSAIESWGYAFDEGRDLRDFHFVLSVALRAQPY